MARAHARLGVAVTRGLLLDLLATRDRTGVDGAMEAFIDVYDTWLADRARSVSSRAIARKPVPRTTPGNGAPPRAEAERPSHTASRKPSCFRVPTASVDILAACPGEQ